MKDLSLIFIRDEYENNIRQWIGWKNRTSLDLGVGVGGFKKIKDRYGNVPLMWAKITGRLEVVKCL